MREIKFLLELETWLSVRGLLLVPGLIDIECI